MTPTPRNCVARLPRIGGRLLRLAPAAGLLFPLLSGSPRTAFAQPATRAPAQRGSMELPAGAAASFGLGYGGVAGDNAPSGLSYGCYGNVGIVRHIGFSMLAMGGSGDVPSTSGNTSLFFGAAMLGLRVYPLHVLGPYLDGLLGYTRSVDNGKDTGPAGLGTFGFGGAAGWNINLYKDFGLSPHAVALVPMGGGEPILFGVIGLAFATEEPPESSEKQTDEAPPGSQTAATTASDGDGSTVPDERPGLDRAPPVDTDWAHVSERALMTELIGKRVQLTVTATGAENQRARAYWRELRDHVFPLVGGGKFEDRIWRSATGGGTCTAIAAPKAQADVFLTGSPEKVVHIVGRLQCSTRGWNESGGCLVFVESATIIGQLNQAPSFDRGAAAQALGEVALADCKKPDGTSGAGHVKIIFSPDGSVGFAAIDSGPFSGTPVGECIVGHFQRARVPAFSGGPVTVGKSFSID